MKKSKIRLAVALFLGVPLSLLALYILAIVLFVFGPDLSYLSSPNKFDSKAWINWEMTTDEPSLRWNMTRDLTKRYNLKRMTEQEIKQLLGDINNIHEASQNEDALYYGLGMSGHGIDYGTLEIRINDGHVSEWEVRHG